jgi:LPPG:FO 2-phospho-L-lactate transferase
MSDARVRTRVRGGGRWWPLQEWLIRGGEEAGPVEGLELDGIDDARPTPEVLEAIAGARALVIGPSNPVISIGPILAVPGMGDALRAAPGPVVAVSPIVGGSVVKGPTEPFMAWAGHELSAAGVADAYEGLLDGMVADERVDGLPVLETDTLMEGIDGRRRVAAQTLEFTQALATQR